MLNQCVLVSFEPTFFCLYFSLIFPTCIFGEACCCLLITFSFHCTFENFYFLKMYTFPSLKFTFVFANSLTVLRASFSISLCISIWEIPVLLQTLFAQTGIRSFQLVMLCIGMFFLIICSTFWFLIWLSSRTDSFGIVMMPCFWSWILLSIQYYFILVLHPRFQTSIIW